MKNFIYLFSIVLVFSCGQTNEENAGIIQRTDDLSSKILEMSKEYQQNSYELTKQIYSDTVKVRFNLDEVDGLTNMIAGWQQEHQVFSNISMSDEYVHTNYFSNGNVWSNFWFTWSATGNATGNEIEIKAHFDYKWEEGKIVLAQGFFADNEFAKELEAAIKQ
jgi:hypothetical protein